MADTPSLAAMARMARFRGMAPAELPHLRRAGTPPDNRETRDPVASHRVPLGRYLPEPPEEPGSAAARVGLPAGRQVPMFQGNRE